MTLILATTRDWFASALEGVLEAESYHLRRVGGVGELSEAARRGNVDAVILDAHLEKDETARVIRDLVDGPLSPRIPILVYSSGLGEDGLYADFLDAGAWDVIEEPVRSAYFLAVLRRFLRLREEFRGQEVGARGEGREEIDGLPTLEGVLDRLPLLEALARREQVGIAVMAVAPTDPKASDGDDGPGRNVARLCMEALRKSDLCGWLDPDEEIAVVAYAVSRDGAQVLAERLARMAAGDRADSVEPFDALSAGIVELRPEDLPEDVRAEDRAFDQFDILITARKALDEARASGGGIRFAS